MAASSSRSIAAAPGKIVLLALFGASLAAVVANAGLYAWHHGNPLVSSDAWYFLEAFVRKVVAGDLSVLDFFVKRGGGDHAQPLNKLLLYLNVLTVGMDFSYEGLAGIAFAVGAIAIVVAMARRESPERFAHPAVLLCLVAICALFLSLNSSGLYTWSLVTMGFSLHFYAVLLIWMCWRSFETGRWRALFVVNLAVGMCADDSAFIIDAACVLALAFIGARSGRYRDAAKLAGVLLLSLLAARLAYAGVAALSGGEQDVGGGSVTAQLGALTAMLPEAGQWLLLPSAASLVNAEQMRHFFPTNWEKWNVVLGLLVLAGQAWFWVTIWRTRASGIVFMAVTLMLLAYGYLAGVLLVRIPVFGTAYLLQDRYVMFYVLVPMAILLLGVERISAPGERGRFGTAALAVAAFAVIALQVPLSRNTWANAVYVDRYWRGMAAQMFAMARNPAVAPQPCAPLLTVCTWPAEQRTAVFRLMQEHRLNLFSQEFDDAHDMHEGELP